MTLEQIMFALAAGAVASVGTTVVGAWASRRFGLPGIARQVTSEQAELIGTLQGQVSALERKANDAIATATESERKRLACERQIREVKRDLRDTEYELLDLYRATGKQIPRRLQGKVNGDHD